MRDKNANRKWYRKPHTTQERRKSFDEPDLVRAARSAAHLPSSYDDLRISAKYDKTWKSKRKEQYLTDPHCKKRTVKIDAGDDWRAALSVVHNIESHLQNVGYSYSVRSIWVAEDSSFQYVVEYHGKSIGTWPYAKYI